MNLLKPSINAGNVRLYKKQFLKEFCIATIFLQNLEEFRAELEYLKNVQGVTFPKIHIVIQLHRSNH